MKFSDLLAYGMITVGALIGAYKLKIHLTEMNRPLKNVLYLVVNTENKSRIASFKTEEAGISDLEKLAANSEYEEEYIFLPNEDRWVETGFRERTELINSNPAGMSVKSFKPFVKKIMKENNSITFYHIHPMKLAEYLERIEIASQKFQQNHENSGYAKELSRVFSDVISYKIPSYLDLESMIYNSVRFRKIQPNGRINFKIVSLFGLTEYHLTEKGHAFFKNYSLRQIKKWIDKNITQAIRQDEKETVIYSVSLNDVITEGIKKSEELAKLFSGKYLSIQYN